MVEENSNLESSTPNPHLNVESSSSTGDENVKPESQSKAIEDSKVEDSSGENAILLMDNTGAFETKDEETIVGTSEVQDMAPADTSSGVETSEEGIHDVAIPDGASESQVDVSSEASGSTSELEKEVYVKPVIDTSAPIESVKEAVSKFGGITDWKTHKVQSEEKRKIVELELEKVQGKIPEYKKQTEAVENEKSQVLNELDNTKRLIEELKLNLERAQTEENQAKQDSELAKLRVEEVEQGIGDDASVAAKAQIEVAKERHAAAVEELKSVKEELEKLRVEFSSLVVEKELAVKRAEETVSTSKKVEKTVEELTLELIATKETLESAHVAHMEVEDRLLTVTEVGKQNSLNWDKELQQAEEELQDLNHQLLSKKDLESRLETTSTILLNLQAEVSASKEENSNQESSEGGENLKAKDENELRLQEAVASAKKELEEMKLNIERATAEVSCLKAASKSLRSELEREKSELVTLKEKEGTALMKVASLEADLNNTKLEMAVVQMKEKEAKEKVVDMPKSPVQRAADEADQAKSLVLAANEELRKAKEEAVLAKASVSVIESRLRATEMEIEAARAAERLALAAAEALEERGSVGNNDEGVTLPFKEYDTLSKKAYEAEEQASMRVAAALTQIEAAKESELKSLEKLEEVNKAMVAKREELTIATEKAQKSKDRKLETEQELRKWRDENVQRGRASDVGGTPRKSMEVRTESKSFESDDTPIAQSGTSSKVSTVENTTDTESSPESKTSKKRKKKSLFPRIIMYFARRKSLSPKVV